MKWKDNIFLNGLNALKNINLLMQIKLSVLILDRKHSNTSQEFSHKYIINSYLHLFKFCVFDEHFIWKTVNFVFLKRPKITWKTDLIMDF